MGCRNLSAEFEAFAGLAAQGLSQGQIASRLKITTRTVQRWRVRLEIQGPPAPVYPPEVHAKVARFLADECSIAEAARSAGVSPQTVSRWFPDAHRFTRNEAGHVSALRRLEKRVTGS